MNQLGIFAKFWQPGAVKTRLAATIGDRHAANIYRRCVELLLARHQSSADRLVLCVTPANRMADFKMAAPAPWQIWSQVDGNLGDRMQGFFARSFESSRDGEIIPGSVVLIGSDCPHLQHQQLQQAFNVLLSCDVVLGPSLDGGYYLVGMRSRPVPIFSGVEWSTDRVLSQTLDRLADLRLSYQLLDPLRDLDTLEDLQHLDHDLREFRTIDKHDATLKQAIQEALTSLAE